MKRRTVAAAAAATAAAAALSMHGHGRACAQGDGTMPDRTCTPGAYDPSITKTQVCNGQAAGRPRQVSAAMKRQVIVAYGYDPATFRGEIDHLVSRQFGGTDVVANLWPEPGPIPNKKDVVEDRLRREVCAGHVTLARAREVLATDWKQQP